MKAKKLSKKLTLNKKTIAHLENGEMKNLYGGEGAPRQTIIFEMSCDCTDFTCNSCIPC